MIYNQLILFDILFAFTVAADTATASLAPYCLIRAYLPLPATESVSRVR